MPIISEELLKREASARAHIDATYGTVDNESGASLFVSHHLDELDSTYWHEHTGSGEPDAHQVLRMLVLLRDPEEEAIDFLDFTLPGGVSDYVLSVEFNETGDVIGVSIES
ncbi:MAG: DUF2004 domain-containing protein [Pseudomonadota bacterium]